MLRVVLLCLCGLSVLCTVLGSKDSMVSDTVATIYGKVQGKLEGQARVFRGVPFAAPPVGSNRWRPPQPLAAWNGTKQTFNDPAGCIQPCELPPGGCPATQSEDCLFLNIFTPLNSGETWPVMVYIHGGNFKQGFAGGGSFSAEELVNKSATIAVFVQYRLGAMGFLVTDSIEGNFGISDQTAALKWVQQNIKAFGGDPSKVTLAGQSAGAASVGIHLVSKLSDGLFSKGIMESLPFSIPLRNKQEGLALGQAFADLTPCKKDDDACLRGLSSAAVLEAQIESAKNTSTSQHLMQTFMPWEPTIGVSSLDLDSQLIQYFQKGNYKHMPLMSGTTSEEAVVFIYEGFLQPMSVLDEILLVGAIFGLDGVKVLAKYPTTNTSDTRGDVSVLATDYVFVCPHRNATESFVKNEKSTYLYQYSHVASFGKAGWGPDYACCWEHVCHAAEIPFALSTLDASGYTYTADEGVLTKEMMAYWTNFVHSGDPNSGPNKVSLAWPSYETTARNSINFQTPKSTIVKGLRETYCDFWDGMGYLY